MEITPEETEDALKIAREMIDAGVPIFAAAPNPDWPGTYYLPKQWEKTVASQGWLDRWRPGWALGAVGGHVMDFLDFDPRNGGDQSQRELEIQGQIPRVFGVQSTPSGGTHLVISLTGERKATGFMPGVDLLAGNSDGVGRGFVFIAPTVRPSKAPETLGQLRAYRWQQPPDLGYLAEFPNGDDTLDGLIARVHASRSVSPGLTLSHGVPPAGSPFLQPSSVGRTFTTEQAMTFCTPALVALERAPIGTIEECANTAAVALAHFVPSHWTAEFAFSVLVEALGKTAYDPSHPASSWTVEKFRVVLDGSRPVADGWKAEPGPPESIAVAMQQVQSAGDAVDALLAEMLSPAQVISSPPPQPLIKGLLNLNSESWVIGAPGSKKSFAVLDMAAHVAAGLPWQGLKVTAASVVLVVAEGAGGLGPRLRAWEIEHGLPGEPLPMVEDRISILPRPVQAAELGNWAVLIEACRRLHPGLIVLDTQARVTVGLEENSAKEMGVFTEAVRALREATGACVLVVHHTGRQGGDARGSSAIDGAQHSELKVISDKGSLTGTLVSEKQKDMALAPDIGLVFATHTTGLDDDGDPVTSLALVCNELRKAAGQVGQEGGEEWVSASISVKEMIVQVLLDHGEDLGITSAEARRIVVERFFGGVPTRVKQSTWTTSWARAAKDPRVVRVQQRLVHDPLAGE